MLEEGDDMICGERFNTSVLVDESGETGMGDREEGVKDGVLKDCARGFFRESRGESVIAKFFLGVSETFCFSLFSVFGRYR